MVEAPHVVPGGNPKAAEGDSGNVQGEWRGWWFSEDDPEDAFFSKKPSTLAKGFQESIDVIRKECEAGGPFDGILGFSQGAAMAALVCALQQDGQFEHRFKFAILVAGFKSMSTVHEKFYEKTIKIPSLHIIGETDQVIPKSMSEELVSVFESPSVIFHPGGHQVPSATSLKKQYLEFLDSLEMK